MALFLRICLLLCLFTVISCDSGNNRTLPTSTGKAGEIIVVIAQNHWESKLGDAIRKVLAQPYPALPQEEPLFNIVHVKKAGFKGILTYHRNILFLEIGNSTPESMIMKKDIWARGQVAVTVSARNGASAAKLILSKSPRLISHFVDAERHRLMKGYSRIKNKKLIDEIEKKLQVRLSVAKDYNIATRAKRFMWIRKETSETSQGVFIYDYPYLDKQAFSVENIMHIRDSVTQAYVPGSRKGSFMKIVKEYPPVVKEVDFNNNYALEVRGLWEVEGDFMGGPYLSYTILDVERQRVVCVEAYVYCPKFNKRNYLRQLEAILLTLKFTEK